MPEKSTLSPLQPTARQASSMEWAARLGTHALLIVFIFILAAGLRSFYQSAALISPQGEFQWAAAATPTSSPQPLALPPVSLADAAPRAARSIQGVQRAADLHTDIPSRGRAEAATYIVQAGDTLFGISAKFGLQPETILWANQETLGDNPHSLRPGQTLNILPVDGVYHRWSAGDGLNAVAEFFHVTPDAIVDFPGNHLDRALLGDFSYPNIEAGTMLIVPGGRREFVSWSAPVIPLDNPGVARVLGPGACESVAAGAVGGGGFIWPAANHYLSGFDYSPEANHPGIDIDGDEGSAVYAADNGVVVYAGWNNWGYGNVVVINHGNGWQTLYAHLSAYYVGCGSSVYQGNSIAAMGTTGNSTGPHLHFEMMYNGVKVNPHDYIR